MITNYEPAAQPKISLIAVDKRANWLNAIQRGVDSNWCQKHEIQEDWQLTDADIYAIAREMTGLIEAVILQPEPIGTERSEKLKTH